MKVAVLSEAPADEAFVRELIEATLGTPTEWILPTLRTRGWPAVLNALPAVVRQVHYHTDAVALAIVVDTNGSDLHDPRADAEVERGRRCRLCRVLGLVGQTSATLSPRPWGAPLLVGVGTAAPTIEAWYQFGIDPQATEAAWLLLRQNDKSGMGRKQQLKAAVARRHGSIAGTNTEHAILDGRRVALRLSAFEHAFSRGYGPLGSAVRAWR